ncbi:peptide ABC transporter substrate-binding protein [Amycolatopsis sp. CA-230715]|uniref:peptide ABC transporter substrate-binding protein n=1 Tax=Amycolatopsis sp. CA-230715 TaxID=2745196 RepID=UPI001C009FEC|nr:peptide ABC transporter substrate-binding protein [Amycolatopsis sp. CA-230715]
MFPTPQGRSPRRRTLAALAAGSAALVALSACTGASSGSGGGTPSEGGSVSFALPPNATPNWILPVGLPGYLATYNSSIQHEMFVPLVDFNGSSGSVALDEKGGAANPPKYAPDGKSATITLKDLTWSTGAKVTTRDVEFWFNLVRANKTKWGGYSKGRIPDSVTAFKAVDDKTFTLTFDQSYNPEWYTANQLIYVVPLPQAAWDKQSADGQVGDFDRSEEGARKVFDYLTGQAKQIANYNTDPLWKVTNGPFALKEFTTGGQVTLQKNPKYTGQDPAHLDTVVFKPFTSADAEFNVLQSGGVDYGYMTSANLGQRGALEARNFKVEPWRGWAITYIPYNFNNPQAGPAFKQLYVRQAIQGAVDQKSIAKNIWRDMATPGYGPVPQDDKSEFLSEAQRKAPFPFDIENSKRLLTSHGWQPGPDGTLACASPGTAENQCGAGVAAGTRLKLTLLTESGSKETENMMLELKSSLSKVGIALEVKPQPLNTVLGNSVPCTPEQNECSWQLSFFGTQGSWYFPAYPSGDRIFASGASSNLGNYTDPHADELITAALKSQDPDAMRKYGEYLTQQLPVIWLPNPVYQISVLNKKLQGVVQDPLAGMQVQRWYLTK